MSILKKIISPVMEAPAAAETDKDPTGEEPYEFHFWSELKLLLLGLLDFQFKALVTTRMLPMVYGLAVGLTGLIVIYRIGAAFTQSWQLGLLWLFITGPAIFLAVVMTIRVLLEFFMGFFRLIFHIEGMQDQIEGIANQTDDIATGLPRITFWRSTQREKDAETKPEP